MRQLRLFAVVLAIFAAGTAARAQNPAPGQTMGVNDIEMYYEVRGTGEPLLLLHGFGGCGSDWAPLTDSLAARYQLIIPDLRGHGGSTNPSGSFTHRQAALDVFALLDRLNVPRIKAMGFSTGGMTLLHMATQQPGRIDAMVLVGATHYFPEQARAIMRGVGSGSVPTDVRERFARCATRGETQVRQLLAQFAGFTDSVDDMNFTAPYLGTIRARTLIVHGDRDEFFPVDIPVAMYSAIPHSALWIVPRVGHVPIFLSRAREFQEVVSAFLAGDSGR